MPDPIAFLSYVVVTTFTPGPNNIMSMSNATLHGFKASSRFRIGACAGFFGVMVLTFASTVALYSVLPRLKPWMAAVGAVYILWLAYRTVRGGKHATSDAAHNSAFAGAALQFLNPKVILYGMTSAATFIVPYYHSTAAYLGFAAALALTGLVAMTCWAAFGTAFERFVTDNTRLVSYTMGVLLVYCAGSIVFEALPR